ncbi:MAG: ABC transporter permease [Eubacteriaceae bacterium]|nr:ABC transporter permease [Eubacteriaceae bacterium]
MQRLIRSAVTLVVVIAVVFGLLRQMPIEGYFNNYDKMTPTQIRVGLERHGLNRPYLRALMSFLGNLLKGDLGVSNRYRVGYPINSLIAQKMPISMSIGILALITALALGLPLGVLMARSAISAKRFKAADKAGSAFIAIVESIPFAVYCLFIQIYGTELIRKYIYLPMLFSKENIATWFLPVFSLSLANMAMYAMWMRRYMIDEYSREYTRLARAKGVSEAAISTKHVFRNAIVPLSQYLPTSLVVTLMGSLYVESRYSIPGMGGLLVDSIKRQDNTLVLALVVVYTALSIAGVFIGDIAMAVLDPRIRLTRSQEAR